MVLLLGTILTFQNKNQYTAISISLIESNTPLGFDNEAIYCQFVIDRFDRLPINSICTLRAKGDHGVIFTGSTCKVKSLVKGEFGTSTLSLVRSTLSLVRHAIYLQIGVSPGVTSGIYVGCPCLIMGTI